jgi:hypothetical protein
MFWTTTCSTTSCHAFGSHPASFDVLSCLSSRQKPAFWHGTSCRKFGCHETQNLATLCLRAGEILLKIWMSQGPKPGNTLLLDGSILSPFAATTCLMERDILPHAPCNSLTTVALVGREKEKLATRHSKLERVYASLKSSRHLLQQGDGEPISHCQPVFEVAIVDATMGYPPSRRFPVVRIAVSSKATRLPDEAEGGKGCQPIKPLSRVGKQVQFAFLRADDDVPSLCTVFDQRGHAGPSSLFYLKERACGRMSWHRHPPLCGCKPTGDGEERLGIPASFSTRVSRSESLLPTVCSRC